MCYMLKASCVDHQSYSPTWLTINIENIKWLVLDQPIISLLLRWHLLESIECDNQGILEAACMCFGGEVDVAQQVEEDGI